MPMQGNFDATQFAPKQVGESHPVGKFPARIGNTEIVPTKDQTGGMFVVTFVTPVGEIPFRYNLWNSNAKSVEIAHGQLSALCHATGVFKLDFQNDGAALRNSVCQIDVKDQLDKETKLPNGYTQVSKVYDAAGNEPGKPPANQPQPQQQAAQNPQPGPMTAQQNGGWGNPAPAQNNAPAGQAGGWGQPQTAQAPANQAAPNAGWNQNPNPAPTGNAAPPWAK